MTTITTLLQSIVLAQSLDDALSEGLGIIMRVAFLIGVIIIIGGGMAIRGRDAEGGKMAIIGGIIIAASALIMIALFEATGMDGAVIDFRD